MKKEQQLDNVRDLLTFLAEDPGREGLEKTPNRFLSSMEFLTSGYHDDLDKIVNGALYTVPFDDMVIVRGIEFYSLCEHHMLPFFGHCHIGYIPDGKVLGLSKFPRLVNVFARRLQVQERLTYEISHAVQKIVKPRGVGVFIEANHLCMAMRGVQKQSSFTITNSLLGCFREGEARQEFLNLIRTKKP